MTPWHSFLILFSGQSTDFDHFIFYSPQFERFLNFKNFFMWVVRRTCVWIDRKLAGTFRMQKCGEMMVGTDLHRFFPTCCIFRNLKQQNSKWLQTKPSALMSNGWEAVSLNREENSCGGRSVGTVSVGDSWGSCGNLTLQIPSMFMVYTRIGVVCVLTRHGDRNISVGGLVNHGCYLLIMLVIAFLYWFLLPTTLCLCTRLWRAMALSRHYSCIETNTW